MPFAEYRLPLAGRMAAGGIGERRQGLELRMAQSWQLLKVRQQRTPFSVMLSQQPGRNRIERRFSPMLQAGHWNQRLKQRISVQLKENIALRRRRSRHCQSAAWKPNISGAIERQILEEGRPPGFEPSARPVSQLIGTAVPGIE